MLRVAETYQLGRFGEFLLSFSDLVQPTQIALPGAPAQAVLEGQAYVRIDDGFSKQNPDPVVLPPPQLALSNDLRIGSTIASDLEATVVQVRSVVTSTHHQHHRTPHAHLCHAPPNARRRCPPFVALRCAALRRAATPIASMITPARPCPSTAATQTHHAALRCPAPPLPLCRSPPPPAPTMIWCRSTPRT